MKRFLISRLLFLVVCFNCTASFVINTHAAQVLPPITSPFGSADNKTDADGFETDYEATLNKSPEKEVGAPQIVEKTPIFDNAPFLHLKNGDNLVKGRRWNAFHKGVNGHFANYDSYFLSSNGKFYHIGSYGIKPKFNLSDVSYSFFFDWDFTPDNAARLYAINLHSSRFTYPLNLQQYKDLRASLRKDFASSLRDDKGLVVREQRFAGEGKNKQAVFEGLFFDVSANAVFHYRVLIGPNTYAIKRRPLIKGPRPVRREEFEGRNGGGINGPGPYYPTKEEAAGARSAYLKSQAFRKTVASVLPEPQRTGLLSYQDY